MATTPYKETGKWVISLIVVAIFGVAIGRASSFLGSTKGSSEENMNTPDIAADLLGAQKKEHHKNREHEETLCSDGKYSKRTLKLAYELPFAALFWGDPDGVRKYEASDVILVEEYAYAVCDSSWAIAKFNAQLSPFGADNKPIYDLDETRSESDEDSGYEAILHENGTFYVIRESVQHQDSTYRAIVEELSLQEDQSAYTIQDQCSTEFEFEGSSKGFEGAIALYDVKQGTRHFRFVRRQLLF